MSQQCRTGVARAYWKGRKEGRHAEKPAKRTTHVERLIGKDDMRMFAFANNGVVNDSARKGGFSPSQWVLGKFPRAVGDVFGEEEFADIGLQQEKAGSHSAFNRSENQAGMQRGACKHTLPQEGRSCHAQKSSAAARQVHCRRSYLLQARTRRGRA